MSFIVFVHEYLSLLVHDLAFGLVMSVSFLRDYLLARPSASLCLRCSLRQRQQQQQQQRSRLSRNLHSSNAPASFHPKRSNKTLRNGCRKNVVQQRQYASSADTTIEAGSDAASPDLYIRKVQSSHTPAFSNLNTSITWQRDRSVRTHFRSWADQYVQDEQAASHQPEVFDPEGGESNLPGYKELQHQVGPEEQDLLQQFDYMAKDYEGLDEDSIVNFRQGDLVQMSGFHGHIAVFLRQVGPHFLFYTEEGSVISPAAPSLDFHLPGFASQDEVAPILPHTPSNPELSYEDLTKDASTMIPRDVGADLNRKMMDFRNRCENSYREHAAILDNLHAICSHPTEAHYVTLEDLARTVQLLAENETEKLDAAFLLAVNNAAIKGSFGITTNTRAATKHRVFLVESQFSVKAIIKTQSFIRDFQEAATIEASTGKVTGEAKRKATALRSFVKKAKTLISRNRELRIAAPDRSVLCSKPGDLRSNAHHDVQSEDIAFSDTDMYIIQFLSQYVSNKIFAHHPTIRSLPSVILRAVDMYEDIDFDQDTAHTFLVEIGVLQPWQNWLAADRRVRLSSEHTDSELRECQTKCQDGVPVAEAYELTDTMADLREDRGDLPVFCIDNASTFDVDDGLSIEDVENNTDQTWVHVHIAHPSALIQRDSVVAQFASDMFSSVYLPDLTITMLPKDVTKYCSLKKGGPALTCSMRIDSKGVVLETLIRPSTVNNVVLTTYDAVNEVLSVESEVEGNGASDGVLQITTGQLEEVEPAVKDQIEENQKPTIRRLHALSQKIADQKLKSPFIKYLWRSSLRVQGTGDKVAAATIDHLSNRPTFSLEDPDIELCLNQGFQEQLEEDNSSKQLAERMVGEYMTLACHETAKWASSRGIPLAYNGTIISTDTAKTNLADLRAKLEVTGSAANEELIRQVGQQLRKVFGIRHLSSSPVPHRMLGFSEYAKVTSPLRRWYDLLNLWQIDAAMRQEGSDSGSKVFPFSREDIDHELIIQENHWRQLVQFELSQERHFRMLLLARAYFNGEAELPQPLTASVSSGIGGYWSARLREVELPAKFVDVMEGMDGNAIAAGDIWEVEIERVRFVSRVCELRPMRRIRTAGE